MKPTTVSTDDKGTHYTFGHGKHTINRPTASIGPAGQLWIWLPGSRSLERKEALELMQILNKHYILDAMASVDD
jgi:hypothetical protein